MTFPFIGNVAVPANTAWIVGQKKGFFDEFGIDLKTTYLRGTNALIPAIVNQEGWLGSMALASALTATEKGASFRILGGTNTVPPFLFFGRPGLRSMADLAGKSVGSSPPGSLTYDVTNMLLKATGMIDKVQIVAVGPTPDIFAALVAGKIDAGLGNPTFIPTATKEGLVILDKLWERFPKYVSTGFVSTAELIGKHRDEIVRALAGFAKTYRYVITDPTSKADWLKVGADEFKWAVEEAEMEWKWHQDNRGFPPDVALTRDQIDFMQQLNVETGAQSKVLPIEQVADFTLVQEAIALTKG